MTVAEAFAEYKQRLEISQTEQDDAIRRQKSVRECVQKSFDVERDFLTGSYGRHTKTKPLEDVDIFVVLGEDEKYRLGESPKTVLQDLKACLVAQFGSDGVASDRRCITVMFDKANTSPQQDGKILSVDVTPALEVDGHFRIPDSKLSTWISTDPEVHAEKATAKNKELGGNWVPLVKMLKGWNRGLGKTIRPSFLVEVMALGLIDTPFNNFPDEVRRFFAAAADTIGDKWPDPAGLGPAISDEMTTSACDAASVHLRQAERTAALAFRAAQQGRTSEAIRTWGDIFGRLFPSP